MLKKDKSKRSFTVDESILKSVGITVEELTENLGKLRGFLGAECDRIVPSDITDVGTLGGVIDLTRCLERLSKCRGFDIHITRYKGNNGANASYFVALVASHLVDKVEDVELEPRIPGEKHQQDILVTYRGEHVYLECKTIQTRKFDYGAEHRRAFSILNTHVKCPHQIDIIYKRAMSDEELHMLGKAIEERCNSVTGDGRIIDNADVEVIVQKREAYQNSRGLEIVMGMTVEDQHSQCLYPGHVYFVGGRALSLSGPKVDYGEVLRGKLGESRKQCPAGHAYVLAINCNDMLGSWSDNIRSLSSAFQPQQNGRFSAVLLVRYHRKAPATANALEFEWVGNPFTRQPVSQQFQQLFRIPKV